MYPASLKGLLTRLRSDERGLSTVEYVVLLVLIVAIAVALWNVFGNLLVAKLSSAAKEIDQEVATTPSGSDERASETSASSNIDNASGGAATGGAAGGGSSTAVAE